MTALRAHDRLSDRRQRGGSIGSVLLSATVLSLGALGWWYWSADDSGGGLDADRVVVVELKDLVDAVNASGRVEPLARVAVMSRASGILEKLLVEEGDVVTAGQVLAELDREQLAAQLAQTLADLASAKARLSAAKARVTEAEVRLDDPELAFAEREAERLEQLYATGDVTKKENDDAQQRLEAVRFRIEQVRANLTVLKASIEEAEANLAASEADLDRSETALREATVRSPIDGVVLTRDKEVGDGVSSLLTAGGNATQIMTLGDLSSMYIEARVDEVDLGRITVGMPALVTVDAHRGVELQGQVARIAPAGSVDNNGIVTFEVRVTVADPDSLLRPDMTADARLVLRRADGTPVLPQRALVREGKDWVVQVVTGEGEGASLEPRIVTLGVSDGLFTEVLEGVAEGDRVLLPSGGSGGGPPRRF
jgi:HlyD family secretion protein